MHKIDFSYADEGWNHRREQRAKTKQPFAIDRVSSDPIINTVPLIVIALQKSMSFNAFQLW